jgi:putative ABC transport system ATP-binding protein
MDNLVIDAQRISKSYGKGSSRFDALKDVTFQVARGECVAIVGKSGSGKSTLMHIIALLDEPGSGSLAFDGVDTSTLSARAISTVRNREFGFVFQQFFLTSGTSVLDNVTLPLMIAGVSPAARRKRGLEVLTQFELADKAKSDANELSGGQKQRVVISRALVNEPTVIFADEPTGNLDSATGKVVEDALFELNRTLGITLIIVTHDEELAARCNRQVFLRDGEIVDSLSPKGAAA